MTNSHQPWRSLSLLVILSLIILPQTATRTAGASVSDLQGIQKLHRRDIDATLSGDPQALADLFTEDAVLLEPGSASVIGKPAILAGNKKEQAEHPGAKIMSYKPDLRDTQIAEGWAYEWGYFDSSFRESEKGDAKSFRGKALRVLRRQPDGSWKFARVMWNLTEDTTPGK